MVLWKLKNCLHWPGVGLHTAYFVCWEQWPGQNVRKKQWKLGDWGGSMWQPKKPKRGCLDELWNVFAGVSAMLMHLSRRRDFTLLTHTKENFPTPSDVFLLSFSHLTYQSHCKKMLSSFDKGWGKTGKAGFGCCVESRRKTGLNVLPNENAKQDQQLCVIMHSLRKKPREICHNAPS